MTCDFCGSTEGVREFAILVDGQALRLRFMLCTDHGERYLLRCGQVAATLDHDRVTIGRMGVGPS